MSGRRDRIGTFVTGAGLAMMAAAAMAQIAVDAMEPEPVETPKPKRAPARTPAPSTLPPRPRDSGTREIERRRRQLAKIAAKRQA